MKHKKFVEPEMTVEEAMALYPGEWILMEITVPNLDDYCLEGGLVLFHSQDESKAREMDRNFTQKAIEAGARWGPYLFRPSLTAGDHLREALNQLVEKGLVGDFGR